MGQKQQQPIPFLNAQQSGMEELGGASPSAMNVIVRGSTMQRRPGLGVYSGVGANLVGAGPVSAILVTQTGTIYAVSGTTPNRYIYRVTSGGSVNLSLIPDGDLRGTGRPQMVETESILAIAGGDRMQKVVLSTDVSSPLANAPAAPSVIFHASRLLAPDQTTKTLLDYSGIASGPTDFSGFETWGTGVGTAGFISVNAKPSTIQAIGENTNEVFAWTTRGLQVFGPDPNNDYVPTAAKEYGVAAPGSVVKADQNFAWLDHLRRFVISDGRDIEVLSTGIQKNLNDMEVVSDCFGYRYVEGDVELLIWTFPTDGRTFVYQKAFGWSEWSSWETTNNWRPWGDVIVSHHETGGTNLVGGASGQLVELTLRNKTDLGQFIPAHVTTGFMNRGSENRKTCNQVQLTLRRGQTTGTEPVGLLSWRDDLGPFGTPIEVGFGAPGDTEAVVSFYGLGVYRRRQWRFTFTGMDDLQLVAASETFTTQGN